MSKGFLRPAARHAARLLNELRRLDPKGESPIVGVEPSELYAFKHEYADLLPEREPEIAHRTETTWLLEEFLIRSKVFSSLRIATANNKLFFHPHCHQRAEGPAADSLPSGVDATMQLLRLCGYDVQLSSAGCCGMAGTFGYEAEHHNLSQQIGELRLLPRLRELPGLQIAATGAACRMQIAQATEAEVQHPLIYAQTALRR
jgi:Fe-S oxidoreductase